MTDAELEKLPELIEASVLVSARWIADAVPTKQLIGYALGTDDDLASLYSAACTAEGVASDQSDIRFMFVDWTLEPPASFLDPVNQLLNERIFGNTRNLDSGRSPQIHEPVEYERIFSSFVEGLTRARRKGVFSDTVFLTVGSTDPGPRTESLERAAIPMLNSSDMVRMWRLDRLRDQRLALRLLLNRPRDSWTFRDMDNERVINEAIARLEAELAESA